MIRLHSGIIGNFTDECLRNAMILNGCLSIMFIVTGSFRGLINFKGKLSHFLEIPEPLAEAELTD